MCFARATGFVWGIWHTQDLRKRADQTLCSEVTKEIQKSTVARTQQTAAKKKKSAKKKPAKKAKKPAKKAKKPKKVPTGWSLKQGCVGTLVLATS